MVRWFGGLKYHPWSACQIIEKPETPEYHHHHHHYRRFSSSSSLSLRHGNIRRHRHDHVRRGSSSSAFPLLTTVDGRNFVHEWVIPLYDRVFLKAFTLPKTNIASENRPLEKESPALETAIFRCKLLLVSGRVFMTSFHAYPS